MQLGTLTEKGISMYVEPLQLDEQESIFSSIFKKVHKNENIAKIIKFQKSLKKLDSLANRKQILKAQGEKLKILQSLAQLMKVHKGSKHNQYKDKFELLRGQITLIELGFHCLTYGECAKYEQKKLYFKILKNILVRSEFLLINLSFSE